MAVFQFLALMPISFYWGVFSNLSLRGDPRRGSTKQSSGIATVRFAHLAMTKGFENTPW
jgi:hypothetical protein